MITRIALAAVTVATRLAAQELPGEQLRMLAFDGDSTELAAAVKSRPADARELLGRLIEQAGRSRSIADSLLPAARRVAWAFVVAWNDSFPTANLSRFERMTAEQRSAKISADSLRLAGNAALDRKGVWAAIRLWREAARRAQAIADTAGMAAATGNIGAGFYRASELDSAESYLTRARRLADAVGDRRTALNALGILGSVASERGDLHRAQETYVRTLALRATIGDVRGAAADHNNLGLISADLGDLSAARAHYGEALGIARTHSLDEAAATALLNLANVASVEGEYEEALKRYTESLALFRAIDDDASSALALHDLGLLALRRGDYREARARLHDALALFGRAGTVEDLVQVRRDLATLDAAVGDLRSALGQLRRADQLLVRAPEQHSLAAAVALARADLASQLNTFTEADKQYARAQGLYRQAGDAAGEAEARQGRAMLLIERKQYGHALELLRAVLRTQISTGDRRPAALTRLLMARAQQRMGDAGMARRSLETAFDTLRAVGDAVGEAETLLALGDLELEAGAPLAAEAHYRRGIARMQGRRVPTISWQLHAGLGRALRNRGAAMEAAAELGAAIADVERMARTVPLEERRATFLADKWQPYADLALVEQTLNDAPAAFAASERMRGRQLLDVLSRARIAQPARTDSALASREQDLRLRISELTRRLEGQEGGVRTLRGPDLSDTSSGVTREALSMAHAQYAQLMLDLRDASGAGALGSIVRNEPTSWREVASRLLGAQVLLTYLVSDSTTLAIVVTPDTVRVLDLNIGRSALASLVDFTRGTVARSKSDGGAPAWRAPLRRLHGHLIAPLEEAGLFVGVKQLVIVPNAELHYMPFAALIRAPTGRNARDEFLIERYDVSYAPSASAWLRIVERTPPANDRVLALAPRSAELPGSREEVESIRALYGRDATVLTNAAATERAFRASAPQYGIVHLATYGVLNQHNPLFSFVDLSPDGSTDGRLEVHEVYGLALNARLLVLSACQTALASGAVADVPAGDDWVGLVQAFLSAGVRNVIATLWAVEDRSTARVMQRLHKRLRAGESETSALSQAQRETLRNSATSSPFYWAGFVLVGGG